MEISGACDVASMSTHRYTTLRRAGALAALLAAVVLLAAACSGSNASGGGSLGGSASHDRLAYSRCMRGQGVRNFPVPKQVTGGFQINLPRGVDPNNLQVTTAQPCQHYLGGT